VTSLDIGYNNALLLNGVKVDLLSAGCFGVGDGRTGCNDGSIPWRYDPMHLANGFRVDSHNAHAQPDGTYHYHGSPFALFADDATEPSAVIGFAVDGFPIHGSYVDASLIDNPQTDVNQGIRKELSSYRLRSGSRPDGEGQPGGIYDGAFRDDYEYIEGLGDLDECNGMLINGQHTYFFTDNFPYILTCFKGAPDDSFRK
jgi:hypothetical protein